MNIREILNEEKFPKAASQYQEAFTIYVNPTSDEIKTAALDCTDLDEKEVRFITDMKDKKLYVFTSRLIHMNAAKAIGVPYNPNSYKKLGLVYGTGIGKNGIIEIENMPRGYKKALNEFLDVNKKFRKNFVT